MSKSIGNTIAGIIIGLIGGLLLAIWGAPMWAIMMYMLLCTTLYRVEYRTD